MATRIRRCVATLLVLATAIDELDPEQLKTDWNKLLDNDVFCHVITLATLSTQVSSWCSLMSSDVTSYH